MCVTCTSAAGLTEHHLLATTVLLHVCHWAASTGTYRVTLDGLPSLGLPAMDRIGKVIVEMPIYYVRKLDGLNLARLIS